MVEHNNVVSFNTLSEKKAGEILKDIIKDSSRVKFTHHASDKMVKRGVNRSQVIKVLSGRGQFKEPPCKTPNGNWKMTITGISAGHKVSVVCALDYNEQTGNYVVIITTYIL
ncbi:DUF4258 domain-containing protein [Candidatus Venteria ishoeyi]|uniref:DUF4258 domain-containing protein n=1 Tax=Candidatus Venteria ishoeyi TaxID=1899563 RepID=A0A1H6FCV7_9GAMM|nr:DUF4258 domain-containing protein [Candidatus Venteria ishoeyi]SEH07920.1 Uncharacterised protein [Candidatus Venteria ishoeyi]